MNTYKVIKLTTTIQEAYITATSYEQAVEMSDGIEFGKEEVIESYIEVEE